MVYGTRLVGELPAEVEPYLWPAGDLAAPRARAGGEATALRTLHVEHRRVASLPEVEETWESMPGNGATPGRLTLARTAGGFALTVCGADRGRIHATTDRLRIDWAGDPAAAAHHLFAYALPLWLETRGVPVLHGSAVEIDGRAVGFLGPSGTGKSVLCAELVRLGCGFVADDGLALEEAAGAGGRAGKDGEAPDGDRGGGRGGGAGERAAGVVATPGWWCTLGPPLLRLWPSGMEGRLSLSAAPWRRVYASGDKRYLPAAELATAPGAELEAAPPLATGSASHRLPLAALFLLRRVAGDGPPVRSTRCPPRPALQRLVEHGVAAAPAAALGLAAARLDRLARVAEAVSVRHLALADRADTAAAVLETVRRDLAAADPRSGA